MDSFGNGDKYIFLFVINTKDVFNKLILIKDYLRQVYKVRAGTEFSCKGGASRQPACMASHDFYNGYLTGIVNSGILGNFHASGRNKLGRAAKTGAVVGAKEVVVYGFRNTNDAALVSHLLHITAYLVAGIHGVVSAVIEEIAHIIFFKDFQMRL